MTLEPNPRCERDHGGEGCPWRALFDSLRTVIQGNEPTSKIQRASASKEYFPEIQKPNEGFLNVIAGVKREARDVYLEVSQRPEG